MQHLSIVLIYAPQNLDGLILFKNEIYLEPSARCSIFEITLVKHFCCCFILLKHLKTHAWYSDHVFLGWCYDLFRQGTFDPCFVVHC